MSDNYVEYFPDFPMAADPETDPPHCSASHELWREGAVFSCTRAPAHEGRHEAGIGHGLIAASWERVTVDAVTIETPRSEP